MALITADSTSSGQGIIKVFKLTMTHVSTNTFAGPANPKACWLASHTTTVGANVSESNGTYSLYVGATGAATLFVVT